LNLVFINPWSQDEENVKWTPEYQTNYWRNAYFGLVQLATYIRSRGNTVSIIDAERDLLMEAGGNPERLLKQIEKKVRKLKPDIVGVTGMSWRYPETSKILGRLSPLSKKLGFKLIQGGHHAIAFPEGCLSDHPALDAVFNGFAEIGLERYSAGLPKLDVPGIVYRDGPAIKHTAEENIQNLDSLPVPDWRLVDTRFYTYPSIWIHRSLKTPVRNLDTIASRGCVFHCKFCTAFSAKPFWHSAEYIIEYIKHIRRDFSINSTIFQDSSLGNNRPFLIELCEKLISSNTSKGLVWTANMRANQVTVDIARLMYRAGCRMVFIGFESASDRILKAMDKGTTNEDNIKCAQVLEQAGMPYWASFIAGYPGETEEELDMSIKFARSIHPLAGWANEFFPSPGSRVFRELVDDGRLQLPSRPEDWAKISRIGQKGGVLEGSWSEMKPEIFSKKVKEFQALMQEITDKGVQRRLDFPG
jgi:anaerobic magnesium-protoporphyrin IX monomethyl ester cyclase